MRAITRVRGNILGALNNGVLMCLTRSLGNNMSKILIIGFQRSGTTLLRRLINAHPSIYVVLHETWVMSRDNATEGILHSGEAAGEKIVYIYRNVSAIKDYMRTWRGTFRKDSRVINIVRHPLDVALSNMKLEWMKSLDFALQNQYDALVAMLEVKNIYHVKYEDIVLTPHYELTKIFKYCDLSTSDKLIDVILENGFRNLEVYGHSPKLNKDRVFAYRSLDKIRSMSPTGIKFGIRTCKLLNDNIEGTPYTWPNEF